MKALAITAGNDGWYRESSGRFAERWNLLASQMEGGFPCKDASGVLPWSEVSPPMYAKAFLWDVVPPDVDTIVWVDSDCFQVRPVAMSELPDAPFSAVKDNDGTGEWLVKTWKEATEVVRWFNSGVFIAKRESLPIFDDLKKQAQHKEPRQPINDQKWLNLYAARRFANRAAGLCGWNELGSEWNYFIGRPKPERPIILHFASIKHARETIMDILYMTAEETEKRVAQDAYRASCKSIQSVLGRR